MFFDNDFPLLISFRVFHYCSNVVDLLNLRLLNKNLSEGIKFFILNDMKNDFIKWNFKIGLKIESSKNNNDDQFFDNVFKVNRPSLPNLNIYRSPNNDFLYFVGKKHRDKVMCVNITSPDYCYIGSMDFYTIFAKDYLYVSFFEGSACLLIQFDSEMNVFVDWKLMNLGIESFPLILDGSKELKRNKFFERRYFYSNDDEIIRCDYNNRFLFYHKVDGVYKKTNKFHLNSILRGEVTSKLFDRNLMNNFWFPHYVYVTKNYSNKCAFIVIYMKPDFIKRVDILVKEKVKSQFLFWFVSIDDKIWFFNNENELFVYCPVLKKKFRAEHHNLELLSDIFHDDHSFTHVENDFVYFYSLDRFFIINLNDFCLTEFKRGTFSFEEVIQKL